MPHPAPNSPLPTGVYVDLFAGPGGWDTGIRPIGIAPLGVEWDEDAATTARLAGHHRTVADIAEVDVAELGLADRLGLGETASEDEVGPTS